MPRAESHRTRGMPRLTLSSTLLASFALAILAGSLHSASAQDAGVTKRSVTDPASEELNRLLEAAQSAMESKDYAAAAQDYQSYLAKKPEDALVHFDLGYAYTAMQRSDDAKAEYERAISLDPKMGPAYMNLGLTLLARDPAAAVDPLEHAADLMPAEARPKVLLGAALEHAGKIDAAISQYQAALKLDDNSFEAHFSLGRALLSAHRAPEAETELRKAIQLDATRMEARRDLAESLIAQAKFDAAITELEGYVRAKPNDLSARMDLASALADAGKYDQAIAQLDQAAAVRPEDLGTLKMRAQIYLAEKKYDAAVTPLQKAEAMAPSEPDLPAELGHIDLLRRDYPEALQQLSIAYRLDPTSNGMLADLAEAEYDNKNYAAALRALEVLSNRTELPPAGWFFRGACYDKLGRAEQALDAYQQFLQRNTDQNSNMYFEASSRVRFLKQELENKKK